LGVVFALDYSYQANKLMKRVKMNNDTKAIANLLKVSLDKALEIQTFIDNNWLLDWSECSERKFRSVVRSVAKELNT